MEFPADWSQEVEDLIDATVEDEIAPRAIQRMEIAISMGLPLSQAPQAHFVLGTRYEDLDRGEDALRCYSRAIELGAQNPMVYLFRAELNLARGLTESARADLQKCLLLAPPHDLRGSDRDRAEYLLAQLGKSE